MMMRRMLILMIAVIGMFGSDAFAIYAPSTGRFMQRDPTGYVDGMNLYTYAKDSPLVYTDPSGLGAICRRPLKGGPILVWEWPIFTMPGIFQRLQNINNTGLYHEHVFYDDGKQPADEGFSPNGVGPDDPALLNTYEKRSRCEKFADDSALREAARRCKNKAPFCDGGDGYDLVSRDGKKNCQGFTSCVRKEYKKIMKEKAKSTCSDDAG